MRALGFQEFKCLNSGCCCWPPRVGVHSIRQDVPQAYLSLVIIRKLLMFWAKTSWTLLSPFLTWPSLISVIQKKGYDHFSRSAWKWSLQDLAFFLDLESWVTARMRPIWGWRHLHSRKAWALLPAKISVFSVHWSQMKNMETEFGGSRKVTFILSRRRGERSRLVPQELCLPPWGV